MTILLYPAGRGDVDLFDNYVRLRMATVLATLHASNALADVTDIYVLGTTTPTAPTFPIAEDIKRTFGEKYWDTEYSQLGDTPKVHAIEVPGLSVEEFRQKSSSILDNHTDTGAIVVEGAGAKTAFLGIYLAAMFTSRPVSLVAVSDWSGKHVGTTEVVRIRPDLWRWMLRTHQWRALSKVKDPAFSALALSAKDMMSKLAQPGTEKNLEGLISMISVDVLTRDPFLKTRLELAACVLLRSEAAALGIAPKDSEVKHHIEQVATPGASTRAGHNKSDCDLCKDVGVRAISALGDDLKHALKSFADDYAQHSLSKSEQKVLNRLSGQIVTRLGDVWSRVQKKDHVRSWRHEYGSKFAGFGHPYLPGQQSSLSILLTGNPQADNDFVTDTARLRAINLMQNTEVAPTLFFSGRVNLGDPRFSEYRMSLFGRDDDREFEACGFGHNIDEALNRTSLERRFYRHLDDRMKSGELSSVRTIKLYLNAGTTAVNIAAINAAVRVAVENACSIDFKFLAQDFSDADRPTVVQPVILVDNPASVFLDRKSVFSLLDAALAKGTYDLKLLESLVPLVPSDCPELKDLLARYIQMVLRPRFGVENAWEERAQRTYDAVCELLESWGSGFPQREMTIRLSQLLDECSRKNHRHECVKAFSNKLSARFGHHFWNNRNLAFHDPWATVDPWPEDLKNLKDEQIVSSVRRAAKDAIVASVDVAVVDTPTEGASERSPGLRKRIKEQLG